MKNKILIAIAIMFAINVNAQTPDRKWGIGFNTGAEQYRGDLGDGFYSFKQAYYGFGGLSISRNLSKHFDLELNTSLGEIGYIKRRAPIGSKNYRFRHSLFLLGISTKYSLFKPESKLRPFVFVGLGYMHFSDTRSDKKFSNTQLPSYGFGLTYNVSPVISIVVKEAYMNSDYDNVEANDDGSNDFYVQRYIGITFNLGKPKDTDGDGIPDKKDSCPEVFGLEAFQGCPDTDGDGITDAEDNCPKVAGLEEFQGCPDTDGDGVTDAEDACPKVKGLKEFQGCPDTDGDGITDAKDKCPKIKGLKKFQGCPDTDGDGITDAKDRCPKIKGSKALKGCPDKDKDGIADRDDVCPNTPGIKKNKGCPEIKAKEKKVLEKALHGIKFQSGKGIIRRSSYPVLNTVVFLLKSNPKYNLKIDGHTDSQGDAGMNLKLSKMRAKAVEKYLINKGIDPSRLTSNGFGEVIPIANNKTAKGRAENRRVELKVVF